MLLTSDYDYPLPERLIARLPAAERSGARMMVLHRAERRIEHRAFTDFPGYLRPGDLAVLNDARVIPASVVANDGKLSPARRRPRRADTLDLSRQTGRKARPRRNGSGWEGSMGRSKQSSPTASGSSASMT